MEEDKIDDIDLIDLEARLHARSMSGGSSRRNPNRRIKMKYKDYVKKLTAFGTAVAVATGLIVGAGGAMLRNMKDDLVIRSLSRDFKDSCLVEIGDDPQQIASYLRTQDDFDLQLYLLNCVSGNQATNDVLACTDYGTMGNYLSAHNWQHSGEWKDDMRERALTLHEMDEKQSELDQMASEHNLAPTPEDTLGGAK